MGDRYTFQTNCANCNTKQEAYYAESSGFMSFVCKKCKKINWITMDVNFTNRIVSEEEKKLLMYDHGFGNPEDFKE